jgi:membrane fusion protein
MSTPLFREEAMDAQSAYSLGSVQVHKLPYSSGLTILFVSLIAAIFAYTCLGEYTRKSSVAGILIPQLGVPAIHAELNGVIEELYVKEGDAVGVGDPLALIQTQLSSNDIKNIGETIATSLHEQKRLAESEVTIIRKQIQHTVQSSEKSLVQLDDELKNLQLELSMASEQVSVQDELYQTYLKLYGKNYLGKLDLQRAHKDLLAVKMSKTQLEQRILSSRREIDRAKQAREASQLQFEERLVSLNQKMADYDRQITYQKSGNNRLLTSPIAGYVTNMIAYPSQPVSEKQVLMNIIPQHLQLYANLFIPTDSAGFVKKDQTVRLKIAAFPYQKYGTFSGRIISVSKTVLPSAENDAEGGGRYLAQVVVIDHQLQINNDTFELKSGMQLQADIEVDTRKIIEWVFEPLLGLVKRV